ncbi:hypothetical protein [Geothrix oryzisoli]|uniref:hypothetical protein n=1 Tax=Geothrix oryzisoli TaxID=2922721 RepID=UPI001FAD3C7F|nr:hypothetical protein [Geothrix oryzisoli]
MTALDRQYVEHQAARPEMPRPFDPNSAEGIEFHKKLQQWITKGQGLAERVDLRNRQRAGTIRARRARARAAAGEAE